MKFEECNVKIEIKECCLKIEFEECNLKIGFEQKRALFVGNLHLEVNFGASVDVGRIFGSFFFHDALQALGSHQPSIWKKAKHFIICETR